MLVRPSYEKIMWRKLRLGSFIHKVIANLYSCFHHQSSYCSSLQKKGENAAIKSFTKKFGPPSDIVIAFGDYSSAHAASLKGHHPVLKGIGMRRLLRQAGNKVDYDINCLLDEICPCIGYAVYLVDEYLTSKSCHRCQTRKSCSNFRWVLNPRIHSKKKKKQRKYVLRWGLVTCSNCHRIWNRDYNAAKNMEYLARRAMRGVQERGDHLKRGTSQEA